MTLAAEPWNLSVLIFISLIPWIYSLSLKKSLRESLRISFIFSFFFGLCGFPWVAYVVHQFGQVPWVIAGLAWVAFAALGQYTYILIGGVAYWTKPWQNLKQSFLFSCAFACIDFVLPKLFVDTLGHALHPHLLLLQLTELGGPSVLTFLVVFTNCVLLLILKGQVLKKPAYHSILALSAIWIFSISFGYYRLNNVRSALKQPQETLRVAVIQGNIGDYDKLAAENGVNTALDTVMKTYYSLTDQALAEASKSAKKLNAVIWPETSYPSSYRSPDSWADEARDRELESFVKTRDIQLIFGGYDNQRGVAYNSLMYLDPNFFLQRYYKTVLLWFGETFPFVDFFPIFRRWFPMVGFFGRGPGPVLRQIGQIQSQPLICYEALFPAFTAAGAKQGAQIIINVTNDSWFGKWGAAQHHFHLATLRSIETRTPQIRSTNTGITALISATGEVIDPIPMYTKSFRIYEVPILSALHPIDIGMMKNAPHAVEVAFGVIFLLGSLMQYFYRKRHSTL